MNQDKRKIRKDEHISFSYFNWNTIM